MSTKIIIALGLVGCLLCGEVHANAKDKLSVLKQVNSITGKLLDIADQRYKLSLRNVNSFDDSEIASLIDKQVDIDVLYHVAAVSRAHENPTLAEDYVIDDVFDAAWTLCVIRISKIGGRQQFRPLSTYLGTIRSMVPPR